ncbi:MAG: hypothetical protein EOM77_03560 [Bacteroidia bacterium]|nr:hypothetical protein [Bacteroidia bacterium]
MTITALALLCVPLGKVLIDTADNHALISGADAYITEYTVRLDSTNTPSFLGESSLGTYEVATPSRSLEWVYYPGSRTYPNAHMAVGDLYPDTQQFNTGNLMNVTGAISMTLDWTLLNNLDPSNVAILFFTPGTEYMSVYHLNNTYTSPYTFDREDFGETYKSLHIGLQFHSYASAPDAMFVLNSLEVVYDCIAVS